MMRDNCTQGLSSAVVRRDLHDVGVAEASLHEFQPMRDNRLQAWAPPPWPAILTITSETESPALSVLPWAIALAVPERRRRLLQS